MKKPDFLKPKVFIYDRGDTKILTVVYNNKEENYEQKYSTTFKKLQNELGRKYTRFDSEKLSIENGAKEVHFADMPEVDGLACKCEKEVLPEREIKNWKLFSNCHCTLSAEHQNIIDFDVSDVELENQK